LLQDERSSVSRFDRLPVGDSRARKLVRDKEEESKRRKRRGGRVEVPMDLGSFAS
jgi:hypothetical protein